MTKLFWTAIKFFFRWIQFNSFFTWKRGFIKLAPIFGTGIGTNFRVIFTHFTEIYAGRKARYLDGWSGNDKIGLRWNLRATRRKFAGDIHATRISTANFSQISKNLKGSCLKSSKYVVICSPTQIFLWMGCQTTKSFWHLRWGTMTRRAQTKKHL